MLRSINFRPIFKKELGNPNLHVMHVKSYQMWVNLFNPTQAINLSLGPIRFSWLITYKMSYSKFQNIKPPRYLIGLEIHADTLTHHLKELCGLWESNPNLTHLNAGQVFWNHESITLY